VRLLFAERSGEAPLRRRRALRRISRRRVTFSDTSLRFAPLLSRPPSASEGENSSLSPKAFSREEAVSRRRDSAQASVAFVWPSRRRREATRVLEISRRLRKFLSETFFKAISSESLAALRLRQRRNKGVRVTESDT